MNEKERTCYNCMNFIIDTCEVHGPVPRDFVDKPNNCQAFMLERDGLDILRSWLPHAEEGSLERLYITTLMDAIDLRRMGPLAGVAEWVHSLPDNASTRIVKKCIQVRDVRSVF